MGILREELLLFSSTLASISQIFLKTGKQYTVWIP